MTRPLEMRPEPRPRRPLGLPDQAVVQPAQRTSGDRLAAGRVPTGEELGLDVGGDQNEVHQSGLPVTGEVVMAVDLGLVGAMAGRDLLGIPVVYRGRVALGELWHAPRGAVQFAHWVSFALCTHAAPSASLASECTQPQ